MLHSLNRRIRASDDSRSQKEIPVNLEDKDRENLARKRLQESPLPAPTEIGIAVSDAIRVNSSLGNKNASNLSSSNRDPNQKDTA